VLSRSDSGLTEGGPDRIRRVEHSICLLVIRSGGELKVVAVPGIEGEEHFTPSLRTVYQIAEFLKIPEQKLMALAGLLKVKDSQFQSAALKFAASSGPVEQLSPREHAEFEEYVQFLCER
jgi:hypothetical protein